MGLFSGISKGFKKVGRFIAKPYESLGKGIGGLFKSEEITPELQQSPSQKQVGGVLRNYMSKFGNQFVDPSLDYGGKLTAGLSGAEQKGQGLLNRFIGRDTPELYGLGEEEIRKTLGGEAYDPATSDVYKGFRREAEEVADVAGHRMAQHGLKVGAPQSATLGRIGGVEEELGETLIDKLSGLTEKERQRKLDILPEARAFGSLRDNKDLASLEATQRYGGLPREIEQLGLDNEKKEFLRKITAQGVPMEVALSVLTGQNPQFRSKEFQPSMFERGAGAAADIVSIFK